MKVDDTFFKNPQSNQLKSSEKIKMTKVENCI